ncbi:MAG: YicC family protein [Peptococcaceae bacterium]|nr:YicC family protein [Peptococcaceae bacterium]
MLMSMTGYGRGESVGGEGRLIVELKAVNHRFLEVVWRLPRTLLPLEDGLRRMVRAGVSRGRVEGHVTAVGIGEKTLTVRVDKALAWAYDKALRELKETCGLAGETELSQLAALPGVLVTEEAPTETHALWPTLEEACRQALDQLVAMRRAEGGSHARDLAARLDLLAGINERIRTRSPLTVEEFRARLTGRLAQAPVVVDGMRLAAEVALMAERSDIQEETVRLDSHLQQARACLGAPEPVGRKLDFLLQEMQREVNTIASKAADGEIGRLVVEAKGEIEKMREQVQNIE